MSLDFRNRVVVITNGRNAFGKHATESFAARGAKMIVNFPGERKPSVLSDTPGNIIIASEALSDSSNLIALAVAKFKRIDVLVNNVTLLSASPPYGSQARSTWEHLHREEIKQWYKVSKPSHLLDH